MYKAIHVCMKQFNFFFFYFLWLTKGYTRNVPISFYLLGACVLHSPFVLAYSPQVRRGLTNLFIYIYIYIYIYFFFFFFYIYFFIYIFLYIFFITPEPTGTMSQLQACSSYNSTHYVQLIPAVNLFLTSRCLFSAGSTEAIRGRESCSRTQHNGNCRGSNPRPCGPKADTLTTAPPRPHNIYIYIYLLNTLRS
jgi:hypothetical protein